MRDCKHGSLARSCEICERDGEIAELRRVLSVTNTDANNLLTDYTAKRASLAEAVALLRRYQSFAFHNGPHCDDEAPTGLAADYCAEIMSTAPAFLARVDGKGGK